MEHAFGDVKSVWRRLLHINTKARKAVKIIVSCLVLHNFLIMCGDRWGQYPGNIRNARKQARYNDDHDDEYFDHLTGEEKRTELVDFLYP